MTGDLDGLVQAVSHLAECVRGLQQQQQAADQNLTLLRLELVELDQRLTLLEHWLSDPPESRPDLPKRHSRH